MKPIYGFWLIVILWTFELGSRIVFIITQGRAAWLNVFFYLEPMVKLALGLAVLFVAYAGQMRVRHRIVLVLTGAAMLLAAAIGLFTSLTLYWWVQWPSLEQALIPVGVIIETMVILGAVVSGLTGTTDIVKRLLILCLAILRVIFMFGDLQAPRNAELLALFLVALAVFFGSYRLFTYAGSRA